MSLPSFSLEGKVALITGARRGLGRAIALGFAEAGADLSICDRVVEEGELEKVAEEIRKLGRRSLALQADVTVKSEVDNVVGRTLQEFGTIDILVNNVGMIIAVPMLELRESGWDRMINTDLKSCYLCTQAVGRVMVERKSGVIINISSVVAEKATPGMAAYNSAKAAINMFTCSMAVEWAPYNIRVNGLGPGLMRTKAIAPLYSNPEALERWVSMVPMGHRLAEPEEMVGTAIYLASEASSFVTGQTIYVDGGYLC